jgi:CheY-like chemotaxis protein
MVATVSRTVEVLAVDDSRDDQLLLAVAVEEAHVDVQLRFADNGVEALRLLAEGLKSGRLPDLLLLDLRMPLANGHEVLASLQADDRLWQLPVVVFSSSKRSEDIQTSYERGAIWYERKPSRFPDLVSFVERLPDYVGGPLELGPMDPSDFDEGDPLDEVAGKFAELPRRLRLDR